MENRSTHFHAKRQVFGSESLVGKRLEYAVLEQNLVTGRSYFQGTSKSLSLDYLEGTSEVPTEMKKNTMKISEIGRYMVI